MSKSKWILPTAVAVVGIAVSAVIASSKPKPEPRPVPIIPAVSVQVQHLEPFDGAVTLYSQGVVEPVRKIELVARSAGNVVAVSDAFQSGGEFKANSVLLEIDPRDYQIAVVRAQANLADAKQKLATEQGQARQAKKQWRDLGNREANDLFLRKPQLASAQAQLQAAEAELQQARLDLERTKLKAPFDGRIVEIKANLGQFLAAGSSVATLYASDKIELALPLSSWQQELMDYEALKQGLDIQLLSRSRLVDYVWPARVSRMGAQLDQATRTLDVIAHVDRPFEFERPLKIGQFVEAEIPSRALTNLLRLPVQALRPGNVIWLANDRDELEILPVNVLETQRDYVIVESPQSKSLRVIVSYLANISPGMSIKPSEQAGEPS